MILQVRKVTDGLWVVTERGDDSPLQGPDRFDEHSTSFDTMADAKCAARWRFRHLEGLADGRVERGPRWG